MKMLHGILLTAIATALACAGVMRLYVANHQDPELAASPPATSHQPTATPVPIPAPAAPTESPGDLVKRIAQRLGSADAAEHAAAATALAALPPTQRNWIKIAAEEALDAAVRDALLARLQAIDEQLALAPLPLSLHVANAPLTEVIPLLKAQTHARLVANPYATEWRYTLDMDNAPFWTIIRALSDQHPMAVTGTVEHLGELHFINNNSGMGQSAINGPFICYNTTRIGDAATRPARGTAASAISLMVLADPRMEVLEGEAHFEPAKDELGNVVATEPPPRLPASPLLTRRLMNGGRVGVSVPITPVEKMGEKLPSLTVNARFVVSLSGMEAEMEDVEKHLNEPLKIGDTTFTVTKFTNDAQILIYPRAESPTVTPYVICEIYDKEGTLLRRWVHQGQGAGAGMPSGKGGPYRLHLMAPQKIKEMPVKFELKDLPLPK